MSKIKFTSDFQTREYSFVQLLLNIIIQPQLNNPNRPRIQIKIQDSMRLLGLIGLLGPLDTIKTKSQLY